MIVQCSECGSAFQVDDEKVQNKRFAFTCLKCKSHVIIDNRVKNMEDDSRDAVDRMAHGGSRPIVGDNKNIDDLFKDDSAGDAFSDELHSGTDIDVPDIDALDGSKEKKGRAAAFDDAVLQDSIDMSDFSAEELISATEEVVPKNPEEFDILFKDDIKSDEIFSKEKDLDESVTIDLDTLDIPIEESSDIKIDEMLFEETGMRESKDMLSDDISLDDVLIADDDVVQKTKPKISAEKDTLDDITLDLNSLDIQLDEHVEILPGEKILDEDEKLTLEDAGLTIDELILEEKKAGKEEDEDLKLSLDEIEPGLTFDDLHHELTDSEIAEIMSKDIELPEVDLDKFEMEESDYEQYRPQELEYTRKDDVDSVPAGFVNLSIDYSLTYSRIGGALRLSLIYAVSLLPHLVVSIVYMIVSFIVGFLNWWVVLLAGKFIDDFADIQQNMLRSIMSIIASGTQMVEDRPVFAGRPAVEHSIQLDVIYPSEPSRLLALLRITIIGIVLAALPHILLLIVLTLGMIALTPVGLIFIIATKRWPALLFDFMYRYMRYKTRVCAYITGLIDKYPSFIF